MLRRRPRRRHPAGQDKTDPNNFMKPLVETMLTVRIAISQDGEEELGKNAGEKEKSETSANNGTMGG